MLILTGTNEGFESRLEAELLAELASPISVSGNKMPYGSELPTAFDFGHCCSQNLKIIFESLILAQDERWRRA